MLIFPGVAFTLLKNYGSGKFQEFSLILVGLMAYTYLDVWDTGLRLEGGHTEIFYTATYFDFKSWSADIPSVSSVDIFRQSKQPITPKEH